MARPFHFKLEKILEYRRQLEDQAKLALAKARQTVEEQQQLVTELLGQLAQCYANLHARKQLTQGELWLWTNYRQRLEIDKAQAEERLVLLEQDAEKKREELVARSMERKLLEKLRTKQQKKHGLDAQLKEQNEFDETATLRYGRSPY